MAETRVWAEGTLRWVAASGVTGGLFPTAASPVSGLLGFVQAGMTVQGIQRDYASIEDRGSPSHHKLIRTRPPEWAFTVLEGNTGDYPTKYSATGAGGSVVQYHFELKQLAPEGTETAIYHRLLHAVLLSESQTENAEGNPHQFSVRGLEYKGATGTGYLS